MSAPARPSWPELGRQMLEGVAEMAASEGRKDTAMEILSAGQDMELVVAALKVADEHAAFGRDPGRDDEYHDAVHELIEVANRARGRARVIVAHRHRKAQGAGK